MAQPTIVASWGGGTSNAYCDVAYANAYMDTKVDRDSWDDATESQRAASLIEATRQIDSRRWKGNRYYYVQKLEFPRTMYDDLYYGYPGEYTSPTTIESPANVEWAKMEERVKQATCEQALQILSFSGDDTFLSLQRRGVKSYSESIGKISESYTFGSGTSGLSTDAARLLSWYSAGRRIVRG